MNKPMAVAVISCFLFTGFAAEGFGLVRAAAAAPVVDVAARKAAIAQIPEAEREAWCNISLRRAQFDRRATITGPVRRQVSNAQAAGNALFANIANYYHGREGAAEQIREALARGAQIEAFTEMAPYSPPEYNNYNAMNEPTFQVANFMVPLAHAYLIVKEEYPEDTELLTSVKAWGDRLFEITKTSRDDFNDRVRGVDRRALIAAGWAHWGGAADNPDAVAQAKRYYKHAMRSIGRGGKDRTWKYKGKHRANYVNMTVAAALTAAHALHRAGVGDAYTMAPKGGTIVEGAEWIWEELIEGGHEDLLRARHPGGRSVAWIELFIREFPDHPAAATMRTWRSEAGSPLSGNMAGGPTTCLYREVPGAS